MQKSLSRYWLLLGAAALAVAGLFSLVLVIARTPQIKAIPALNNLFHEALIVHVDLLVLGWFLSIPCLLWSLLSRPAKPVIPFLEEAALWSFGLGMLGIALSPLDSNGIPLMSNYIPVITSPVFFIGLSLLMCGVLLMLLRVFTASSFADSFDKPQQFALFSAALITAIAAAAFVWSHRHMPPEIDGTQYYEISFWGGGHVLQFVHTQIVMVCWLILAKAICSHFKLPTQFLYALFAVGLVAAFATPIGYLHEVTSMEHREFFTRTMIIAGGIAPALLSLPLIAMLYNSRSARTGVNRALWSSLLMSVFLFLYGGFLGGLIQGQNVVIPAHYHGSIVGITLGFMGLAYLLLPQLGYHNVSSWKLAFWQPIVYGGGQWLHVSGLAWSGGYGVLRKTPGGMEDLPMHTKAALGFMGLGGLISIIGGFMFVIVIAKAIRSKAPA